VTTPHHSRSHSQWSASATARNIRCPGALALESLCDQRESEAAAWGTACHEVAQACLDDQKDAAAFLDETKKVGDYEFEVDEEMVACAQEYIDYVRSRMREKSRLYVERRFSLETLRPPFDAGGTCDAIVHDAETRHLEVIDLKTGRGVVVEATNNPQLRTYAIGAMLAHSDIAVSTIQVTVVQPRAQHRDGRIRSEMFTVADLIDWTAQLLVHMRRTRAAYDEFQTIAGNRVKFDEWAAAHLRTGACTFCPAQGICPVFRREALAAADRTVQAWFEDVSAPAPLAIPNQPALMSPEEIAHVLDGLEALEEWIRAVRSYALAAAQSGTKFSGWALYDKIGRRAWAADEKTVVKDLKTVVKMTDDQIWVKKLASPAQVEKIIGAKRKKEIASMWRAPVTGVNLAREDRTERTPAASTVEKHFESAEEK
jgi:hypothetical protein